MHKNYDCNICVSSFSPNEIKVSLQLGSNVKKFAEENFTIWQCPRCDSIHSIEQVDLDFYYAHYPLKEHKLDFIMRRSFDNRINMLKAAGLRKEDSILDYGCGSGLFVEYLKQKGFLAAKGYDPFIAAYNDREVLDSKYRVVTCYDVIEHVDDPRACMFTLMELTEQAGILAIGTPNASNIDLTHPEDYMLELSQPYHRHILSQQGLKNLAESCGYSIVKKFDRFYLDTLFPFVNTRFAWTYIKAKGNCVDTIVEGLDFSTVFKSPKLLFYGYFGYFFPIRSNMTLIFRLDKAAEVPAAITETEKLVFNYN